MGVQRYSSPFLSSVLDGVELSGHDPADFPPGKQSPVPIVQETVVNYILTYIVLDMLFKLN
jgi:hypothetical protein